MNRVGDVYSDQTRLTGHHDRVEDLARFADLGVVKLRYPAIWERIAAHHPDERDWRWTDERLAEIERLGMAPILGLLHHGSGPVYTDLTADNFVALFTAQAAATAQRYPNVQDWTPINEPLTTARFSALYGLWYPHAKNERLFWLALLNQIDATRAAMKAIRAEIPGARLVQTEDLGQCYSTDTLTDYAEHYNQRRWATWDLLAGRLTSADPLWRRLAGLGFADRLHAIADDPCLPDVVGINHYPTSDRFLDDRLDPYAVALPQIGFHDLTAARVLDPPGPGLSGVLRQAWDRYRLPIAVTESHLGCTREEQVRWLAQSWSTCIAVKEAGVDVRALTAWALLGNVDWNSLITVEAGHYETGAFDVRGAEPRPTAVAKLLRSLGRGIELRTNELPVLSGPGWWERDIRLEHPSFACGTLTCAEVRVASSRPILITGATGTLGRALARECALRGLSHILTDRAQLPIEDSAKVAVFLEQHRPWAVINAAGWVRVDDAELEPEACFRANSDGAVALAQACALRGIHCTVFSSDLVFNGRSRIPYREDDLPFPLNVYGRSKLRAEALSLEHGAGLLVVRTAAFFSPHDSHNFAMAVERTLRHGHEFAAAADFIVTPTLVDDLVRTTLDLVVDGEAGIWHLTNGDAVSWLTFGRMVASALSLNPNQVTAATSTELGWRAERPRYAALQSSRGRLLPTLADALDRHATTRLQAA